MKEIRHSSTFKPISVPVENDVSKDNWDRVQSFSLATTQPTEKVYEIGRLNKVCSDKDILEAALSISQFEYGKIDSFLQLAGKDSEPVAGLTLSDFDDPRTDFYSPGKEEFGGAIEQTLWAQHMALDSFGLSISANEKLERTFDLSGEYAKVCRKGNKYLIFVENDAPSGTVGNYVIDVSDPAPVVDPNNAGVYILDLWRIRSGVATQLSLTDYTYDNVAEEITIVSGATGDNYRIWYTAASYGSAGDPEVINDADKCYLKAENVTVTIDDGTHTAVELDKLTSLSIAVTLNRNVKGKIGTIDKFKDVESKDVTISLENYVKDSIVQEVLMQQAGQDWGIIDFSLFGSVDVVVKIYQEAAKTNFLIGYKSTDMDFTSETESFDANSFGSNPLELASDNLLISTDVGNL